MMAKERRVLIGHVAVDSGQLLVMDPCYVESEWKPIQQGAGPLGGGTYEACCQATDDPRQSGVLKFARGHEGLAAVVRTGIGDGQYPVYVTFRDCGPWGGHIAKVEVEFLPPVLDLDDPQEGIA